MDICLQNVEYISIIDSLFLTPALLFQVSRNRIQSLQFYLLLFYFFVFVQIKIQQQNGLCPTPVDMAGQVVSYLDKKGFLQYY